MPGQPLRLGPFIGGLNTASDPTAIADAELAVCTNFELDIDGSLVARSPMKEIVGSTTWTERIICLMEAVFSGVHYLIGSNSNGVYHYTSGGSWTLITSTFQAYAAVQYAGKVYLIPKPGAANPGGKWDPSAGFTAVAAIPQGQAAVVHKERLFICPGILATTNESRLKFSDPGNFDVWPAPNFIDIGQGDGTNLIDLTIFQDNILLFKNQTTYVLSYDVKPTDAVIRKISLTIGVDKQYNVVNYENQVYIFNDGWVYEIINYDFHRINDKLPFVRDDTAPSSFAAESIFLSILEDRLICRFYRKVYTYGLITRTWSERESIDDGLQYFGPIVTIRPDTGNEYYSGSSISLGRSFIQHFNKYTILTKEEGIFPQYTLKDTFSRVAVDSWGSADTGEVWAIAGGVGSDYSVDGVAGKQIASTTNVYRVSATSLSLMNPEVLVSVTPSAIAVGALITGNVQCRFVDANNFYAVQIEFKTDSTAALVIYKNVAGVITALTSASLGAYSAAEKFNIRFRVNGTALWAKGWRATVAEPIAWTLTTTDAVFTLAGTIRFTTFATVGATVPFNLKWDDLTIADTANVIKDISCRARTKNFDMSVSHQFKRLWWWGADLSSNRIVTGTATPIVVSFQVTWGDLASYTWGQLAANTWGQLLTTVGAPMTIVDQATGTSRRFVKFKKGLRYRQINFEVKLLTNGSTADGPARLFTMTAITETRQVVSKKVN